MRTYFVLLAVLGILTICASVLEQHAANKPTQESTQPANGAASPKHEEPPKPETENPLRWWLSLCWWLYKFFRWPDATTVWVIILTLVAIAKQTEETANAANAALENARAAKQSVDIVISKERFRIWMYPPEQLNLPYHSSKTTHEPVFETNNLQELHYRLRFLGLTDGHVLQATHGACVSDSEEPPPRSGSPNACLPPSTIDPTDPAQVWLDISVRMLPRLKSMEDIADVVEGRKFIHLWGLVKYRDVFFDVLREKRRTPYRYVWRFTDDPTTIAVETHLGRRYGAWIKCGPEEDNRPT